LQALQTVGGMTSGASAVVDVEIDPAAPTLGATPSGTTVLLYEFAVAAGLSPPIDALVWRGRYPKLTDCVERWERRPSFVATVPQSMDVNLRATVR